jgi:RNA polymerase primary sigma factor
MESTLFAYFQDVSANRVLTKAEEVALFQRLEAGDPEARQEIISCNLKFVIQIAQRFRSRGMPLEDLIQEGNIGLLEAVGKFDWHLGFRFSTYAAFWIRQSIQVAIRQRGSLIRIPVRKARLLGFMNEALQEHLSLHGRMPTDVELARRLEITVEQARELAQLSDSIYSLDTPSEDGRTPLMDVLADPHTPSAEEVSLHAERKHLLDGAMQGLSDRESLPARRATTRPGTSRWRTRTTSAPRSPGRSPGPASSSTRSATSTCCRPCCAPPMRPARRRARRTWPA